MSVEKPTLKFVSNQETCQVHISLEYVQKWKIKVLVKTWECHHLRKTVTKLFTDAADQVPLINNQFQTAFNPPTVYTSEEFYAECLLDLTKHQFRTEDM